ncbi:MAG: carbohydrate binding domain-containing protein [Fibromonadaceae bacterium]|jgi:mannan endo-1,4-beta-mannosidase|nr:carbohydrate binding domain-containing protein [Fibromonadaceae bacterium]
MKKKSATPNLVSNGNFSKGLDSWRNESLKGKYETSVKGKELNFAILEPGKESWSLKFCNYVSLIEGETYVFEMKAKADLPRTLNVNIKKNCKEYLPYANGRMIDLSTNWQDYSWKFTMKEPNDSAAILSFDMGGNTTAWSLKSVSLKIAKEDDLERNYKNRIQKNSGYFSAPNEPWELRFYSLDGKLQKILDKGKGGEGMRPYPREDRSGVIVVKEAST